MNRLLALALAATCCGAFAASSEAKGDPLVVDASLEPKKAHQECLPMDKGEKRRYSWKSSGASDFNIQYREGPEIFYPVKREGMRGDGGTFSAKVAAQYCWTWTARSAPVRIEGRIDPPG
jgi:hypothetical protein